MTLKISQAIKDILSYESDIWSAADVLRGNVGLKNSEFPDYMMPFFALLLVESRLIRAYVATAADTSLTSKEDIVAELKENLVFYNSVIIEKERTLADIVMNDKTFTTEFAEYLDGFDTELKGLLGIIGGNKAENLNIAAVIETLRKSGVLFGYTKAWAEIDFTPFNNSDVTTLEEHIKRKWADMSAETAGEQYTPYDIIKLIARLCATTKFKNNKSYKIYDMTCGGGGMLFGVQDMLRRKYPTVHTETYGQELRGSLYALAKIESMFRTRSFIEQGNTLTNDQFPDLKCQFGVANPPYGVDWKDSKKTIENDQSGRFGHGGYPSVADGQLLFIQNMMDKLDDEDGKAYVVLNGSPMFSGDAGSGESGIRRWLLDNDYLEAFIQLPSNEFFNTGITTYLWCLSKNKDASKKDKILCINAEDMYENMKKNVGNKSRQLTDVAIEDIAEMYEHFKETDKSKVLSKYDFYYNKQTLRKLEEDLDTGAFNNGVMQKSVSANSISIINNETNEVIYSLDPSNISISTKEEATALSEQFKDVDLDEQRVEITTGASTFYVNSDNCIISKIGQAEKNLGYGEIKVKAVYKKATSKSPEKVVVEIEINPVWTKDEEKISYSPDEKENLKLIKEFMQKWVSEDESKYELLDNTVGVEINFNSVFPKKIVIRSTADILAEIEALDKEMEGV